MLEGGPYSEIQRDEEVQKMITSQPNSQHQQSIDILLDTSMVDAYHGEIVTKADDFKTKNIQLDSTRNKNEAQLNSEVILVTQLLLACMSID
jgi:hypothetical protein